MTSKIFRRARGTTYFDLALDKKVELSTEIDANRFFDSVLESSDCLNVVYSLGDQSRNGISALRRAYNLASISPNLDKVMSFFAYLGQDILNRGSAKSCTEACYLVAFQTPGFIECILEAVKKDNIKDTSALAWFLLSVCMSNQSARSNTIIHEIVNLISTEKCLATSQLLTLLKPDQIETSSNIESLEQLKHYQKHDNDFPFDYRKISIIPTTSELNSLNKTDLNQSYGYLQLHGQYLKDQSASYNEANILDQQFRLLREDMIGKMIEELQNKKQRRFYRPKMISIELDPKPSLLISLETPHAIRNRLKSMKPYERRRYLETIGKRILGRDSVLLFVKNGVVAHVAVIVRRDSSEIASDIDNLVVGISLPLQFDSLNEFITELSKPYSNKKDYYALQASSSIFTYEPVLKRLQNMVSVPFADQLAHNKHPTETLPIDIPEDVLNNLNSDTSQLQAVKKTLQYDVSLIQGGNIIN